MICYVLQETVDLGSRIRGVFLTLDKAKTNKLKLIAIHKKLYGRDNSDIFGGERIFITELETDVMDLCMSEQE